ncbi:Hypothetical protein BHW_0026400 (plasmid) [Borrelia hermsii MTW]|uniref:Lipoprotein n=2 Tax=Borrelia hermsii TaxID=140 RepID=W5T5W2_BORHE|nr:Hypothetical protein BHW_0026400 [Borrelia hermsii MTW]
MLMKRVCMVIFAFNILMLGCRFGKGSDDQYSSDLVPTEEFTVDSIVKEEDEPKTPKDAYDALLKSLSLLRESLEYKPEGFDVSRFDGIFSKVWNASSQEDKCGVLVGLKRNIEALGNLETIIGNLMVGIDLQKNGVNDVNYIAAVDLLSVICHDGLIVNHIVNGIAFSKINLSKLKDSQDVSGLNEVRKNLDSMRVQREALAMLYKDIIGKAAILSDKGSIKEALIPIIDNTVGNFSMITKCDTKQICAARSELKKMSNHIQYKVHQLIQ